jgi:hypothetical protein
MNSRKINLAINVTITKIGEKRGEISAENRKERKRNGQYAQAVKAKKKGLASKQA